MARPELTKTELGRRLREIRKASGDPDRDYFASRLGVSKTTVANYERGDRIPDATVLGAYRREFGTDANWIVTGEGEMFNSLGGRPYQVSDGGLVSVQRLDVAVSAGRGALVDREDSAGLMAFDPRWLRDRGVNPGTAHILTASGDSMEPTIRDGDLLLVDTSIESVSDNGIYVAVIAGLVVVKRVQVRRDGTIVLRSDNQFYEAEIFAPTEQDTLHIAGRVMWFGRSI